MTGFAVAGGLHVDGSQLAVFDVEDHREFLRRNGVIAEDLAPFEPDALQVAIQNDMRAQIAHNVAVGVLKEAGEGAVRYSWRGLLFIWFQFLRDLVRFS